MGYPFKANPLTPAGQTVRPWKGVPGAASVGPFKGQNYNVLHLKAQY